MTPYYTTIQAIVHSFRSRAQGRRGYFQGGRHVSTPADVARLLEFQSRQKMPLSVMGMGKYGKVSRLLFAQAGSVLNYGYLGSAQVAGQWPAVVLKQRIRELLDYSLKK